MFEKIGLRHPFFLPRIRRVLTVAAIVLWGCIELALNNPGWATGAFALAALCSLEFFILFKPENYGDKDG